MFKWLVLFLALATPATAQNVTCATRPAGDNSNACASTAFTTRQTDALNVPIPVTNYPGVDPTGATYSDSGFALWLADLKALKRRGQIPKGNYKFQNQFVIDLIGWLPNEFNVECEGYYTSTLDVSAVTVSPQMLIKMSGGTISAPADQFYASLAKCFIATDTKNVTSGTGKIGLSIGMPDGSDALNGNYFDLIVSNNDNINASAVAIQLNKNYASEFKFIASGGGYKHITSAGTVTATNGSTAVTGSGTNFQTAGVTTGDFIQIGPDWFGVASVASNTSLTLASNYTGTTGSGKTVLTRGSLVGSALRIDNTAFSTFYRLAAGQADKSIYFTNGYSFGNSFLSPDLEETNYPLVIDTAFAGKNTIYNGTFAYNKAAINAANGNDNMVVAANIGPKYSQPTNTFLSQVGMTLFDTNKFYPATGTLEQIGSATQIRNMTSNGKTYQDAIDTAGTSNHVNYTVGIFDNHIVQPGSCFGWYVGATLIESVCGANHEFFIPAKLATFTYATRPACAANVAGSLIYMTDSNSNTFNATITGSGANKVMALCDGTNWTVH